jgi:hypothetical protein
MEATSMTATWQSGRAAEYAAMTALQKAGYSTEKITGHNRRFDLIGWKENQTLWLVIRSSKRFTTSHFPQEIATLSEMVRSGSAPGEIQFWIYRRPGWTRYRIQPGGASLITWREE